MSEKTEFVTSESLSCQQSGNLRSNVFGPNSTPPQITDPNTKRDSDEQAASCEQGR
jgi:hypothetical protein